jgi:DNA adenine methylase
VRLSGWGRSAVDHALGALGIAVPLDDDPFERLLDFLEERKIRSKIPWARPVFRWAGSKRRMLPTLLAAMPEDYGRYIEPMVGSACLFFATRPRRGLLGDFNEELMHTYRAIRCHPRLVSRAASSWGDDSATYYEVRSLSAESLDPIQPAARFTYLNRYSFNGVYRTNKEGRFNVPRGRDTGSLPSEADSIGAR